MWLFAIYVETLHCDHSFQFFSVALSSCGLLCTPFQLVFFVVKLMMETLHVEINSLWQQFDDIVGESNIKTFSSSIFRIKIAISYHFFLHRFLSSSEMVNRVIYNENHSIESAVRERESNRQFGSQSVAYAKKLMPFITNPNIQKRKKNEVQVLKIANDKWHTVEHIDSQLAYTQTHSHIFWSNGKTVLNIRKTLCYFWFRHS